MNDRKLFNSRHELFSLLLLCHDSLTAGEMLSAISDVDYYATSWARETYRRIKERYSKMEISTNGVLNFSSLVSDDQLSEETRERLESGYRKFQKADIDKREIITSLSKYRKLRRLNELSENINTALHQGESALDPDVIMQDVEEHMAATKTGNGNIADWFFHMGSEFNMQPVIERIMSDTERNYVPTGIAAFDDKNGGINYGALWLIGGSTGSGKSLVVQNVVATMSLYENVCLVPLEMTEDECVARMMAKEGKVDVHRITGKKWNSEEKDRATEGLKRFHKKVKKQGNKFTIFRPQQDMTIDEIFMATHPYDYRVIAIDYVGLLKGADGDDQWRELGRIARAAKVYAATNNKIVILLAQVSEDGQIRYSRAMGEHANNAWIFVATEHTKEQGILDVKQPKARNQDPTPFTLEVEYKYMSVTGAETGSNIKDDNDKPEKKTGSAVNNKNSNSTSGKTKVEPAETRRKAGTYFDNIHDL